ncbi:MAG: hypothetical protein FJ100_19145 [Deltaproteobacteria bacterium]|nr:hypothetical protein [Deltaproteobacteria bacterium]
MLRCGFRFLAVVALLCAGALPGCVINNHGGGAPSLIVRWTTVQGTCASLGIVSVEVSIVRKGTVTHTVSGPCASGEAEVLVPMGTYDVRAVGLDSGGQTVTATESVAVTVKSTGQTEAPPLKLQAKAATAAASLAVGWTVKGQAPASGCQSAGITKVTVSVFDKAQTTVLGGATAECKAGQILVSNLPAASGAYLQLDGYTASDPAGKPSFGNPKPTGVFTLSAGTTTAVSTPIDLVQLGGAASAGKGNVSVTWTVLGEAPASGCAKRGITDAQVRVLDDKRAELASATVACTAGAATVAGVPAGSGYVQIDAVGPAAPASWGTVNLAGPFVLKDGQVVSPPKALDLGQRTVVSLDWAFESGSCTSHGVQTVFVEVRDGADKVVIPMNDAWAGKPCDLSALSSYDARVLDFGFAQPNCAIPPGAKGLVVCNVTGDKIGLHLTGADSKLKAVVGGSMQISPIVAGTHVALPVQLKLAPCSAGNPCKAP